MRFNLLMAFVILMSAAAQAAEVKSSGTESKFDKNVHVEEKVFGNHAVRKIVDTVNNVVCYQYNNIYSYGDRQQTRDSNGNSVSVSVAAASGAGISCVVVPNAK